jgi:hypothetical protein
MNDEPRTGKVLLYRGTGLLDRLIRWQTRSCYSHAAILVPLPPWMVRPPSVIEAAPWAGVRERLLTPEDLRTADCFDVIGMDEEQWQYAIESARAEIGCRYDWRSVLRFLTRRKAGSANRWFCSELVFQKIREAGVTLLERIKDWEVSPGQLRLSLALEETTTTEHVAAMRTWERYFSTLSRPFLLGRRHQANILLIVLTRIELAATGQRGWRPRPPGIN